MRCLVYLGNSLQVKEILQTPLAWALGRHRDRTHPYFGRGTMDGGGNLSLNEPHPCCKTFPVSARNLRYGRSAGVILIDDRSVGLVLLMKLLHLSLHSRNLSIILRDMERRVPLINQW